MTIPGPRFALHPSLAWQLIGSAALLLAACGGGTGELDGTVTGLTADGLRLTSGTETLALAANTTRFQFGAVLDEGDLYNVTVTQQPTGLSCSVAGGSGTFNGTDAADVVVTCTPVYPISGTVSGLRNNGLVLGNGGESVAVASGALSFAFTTRLPSGGTYAVSVVTQPTAQTCTVTNASGTIATTAVSNVAVTCP